MRYKIVRQPDEMNCGVACLSMICAYYGVDKMSLAVIREFSKTDRDGNSMYSLKIAAEKLNMMSKAYEVTKEDVLSKELKLPAIVHTLVDGMYQHYMVLFEANSKNVILGDPANRSDYNEMGRFFKNMDRKSNDIYTNRKFYGKCKI